jgi:hypothetical protein
VSAQWQEQKVDGIELGQKLVLTPAVEVLGGYDNRVIRATGRGAEGDFYSDLAAGAGLANRPSRYNLMANARYGYRSYAEYDNLNDDFYTLAASIGTKDGPLLWGASYDKTKTLDYNTIYNPATGQPPDSILTQSSKRSATHANVSYDSKRFSKTAIVPSYTFLHYVQEREGLDSSDEWQIHTTILKLRRQYSAQTRIYTGLVYSLQARDKEDGYIATAVIGAEHRLTDKTSWLAELGYAFADYELSGSDHGFVSNLRGNWQATKKVSAYVFGGDNFQPGYGGQAARWVYRLGYGVKWQVVKKFSLQGAILHDYQQLIGDNTSINPLYGTVRNFIDFRAQYEPIDRISIAAGIRHNQDEYDPAQTILTLRVDYRFY